MSRIAPLLVATVAVLVVSGGRAAPPDSDADAPTRARIERLARQLESETVAERREAAYALWKARDVAGPAARALVRAMGSSDEYVAKTARATVHAMGKRALPGLEAVLEGSQGGELRREAAWVAARALGVEAFRSKFPEVRAAAAQVLKYEGGEALDDPATVRTLASLLSSDDDDRVRAAAGNALQLMLVSTRTAAADAEELTPILVRRFELETDPEVSVQLLFVIGAACAKSPDGRLMEILVTSAGSAESRVARAALGGLGGLEGQLDDAARSAILEACQSDDEAIRIVATGATRAMGPTTKVLRHLLSELRTGSDFRVSRAAGVLAGFGVRLDPEAARIVVESLRNADTPHVRDSIALVCVHSRVTEALEDLRSCFEDQPSDGVAYAICALSETLDDGAVSHLVESATSASVRGRALGYLGRLGSRAEGAVPALASALREVEPEVQRDVIVLLGELGSTARSARPVLEEIRRADPMLKEAIERALEQIGSD